MVVEVVVVVGSMVVVDGGTVVEGLVPAGRPIGAGVLAPRLASRASLVEQGDLSGEDGPEKHDDGNGTADSGTAEYHRVR